MRHHTVRTWMTPAPITIGPDETVLEAYDRMRRHRIRRLPVVEGQELVGVISLSDVRSMAPMGMLPILEHNALIGQTRVRRAMAKNPVSIAPDQLIGEAARLMMKHQFRGLPVVENGKLVGVISEADLFRLLIAQSWWPQTVSPPGPDGEEVITLWDGATIRIRPIRPDDAPRLQASMVQMSAETIYDRFLGYKKVLPDEEARYLSNLDYDKHMALVAAAGPEDDENIVGVARYHVLEDKPDCAEFAVVIADAYQRRGLGTLLIKRLIEYAQTHGIRTFLGITHLQNNRLLRFIQRSRLPIERKLRRGQWEVWLTLEGEPFQNLAADLSLPEPAAEPTAALPK